jgi:hypothetical protein
MPSGLNLSHNKYKEGKSQDGVLRATIVATKQQSELNGKQFTTMLFV